MILVLVFFVSSAGCKKLVAEVSPRHSSDAHTVSGTLKLFLHQRKITGLYVCFELKDVTQGRRIAQSGCKRIIENPVHFSLGYSAEQVYSQNRYLLIATVAEDSQKKKAIAIMSAPVLTQGNPAVLEMAINALVAPIE